MDIRYNVSTFNVIMVARGLVIFSKKVNCMEKKVDNIAYLSNKNEYIFFSYAGKTVRFKGPYSLTKIEKVKEWDDGYIVVEARYNNQSQPVEDYIDLIPICDRLYIDVSKFIKPIKKVEVKYA